MSDSRYPLTIELAVSMVTTTWSALRHYPLIPEGVKRLAEILQQVSVSVGHAHYIVDRFDEECPTPKQIREVADATRDKYAPPARSKLDEWKEAAGGQKSWSTAEEVFGQAKTKEDWDEIRWDSIRYALQVERHPSHPDPSLGREEARASKDWWAGWLLQTTKDHPDEVAAIRTDREPSRPAPSSRSLSTPMIGVGIKAKPAVPPPPARPVTPDDLAHVPRYEPKEYDAKRCPKCDGTGKLVDAFCDCELGKELERLDQATTETGAIE